MDSSKQYELFKSLKDTVEKLHKSMADKTTDAIIADIEDPNSKAQVDSNPGNSKKIATMVKGKDQSKGVHKPYMSQGTSMAGELSQEGKNKPGKMGEQNKEVARSFHKQKLGELKDIKPNLPKSEEMNKAEKPIAQRDMKSGQISLRKPKNIGEAHEQLKHTTEWLDHAMHEHSTNPGPDTGLRLDHTIKQHGKAINHAKSFLGKSEEMNKAEVTPHPGKLKDKEFTRKDKAVEAHGNRYDKNPSAENHAHLSNAIKERDDHIAKNPDTKAHINQLRQHMNEAWGGNRPMIKKESKLANFISKRLKKHAK